MYRKQNIFSHLLCGNQHFLVEATPLLGPILPGILVAGKKHMKDMLKSNNISTTNHSYLNHTRMALSTATGCRKMRGRLRVIKMTSLSGMFDSSSVFASSSRAFLSCTLVLK